MTLPLVSILIPAYNAEPWIAETLTSALGQTWPSAEVIVIDDGSCDQTYAIAQTFQSANVKIVQQANQGSCVARNQALKLAQGEFIQYLDADDLLAPDKIARQMQCLLKGAPDWVATGEWGRFYTNPTEACFVSQPLWRDQDPIDWLICAWENHWMMHPAAWLVPRQIAEIAEPWNTDLSLNDDGEYFCRIVLASQTIRFCPGARSFYRSGLPNSLSDSKSTQALTSWFNSLILNTQHLLAYEDSTRTRHACATALQRFIYEVYPHVPSLRHQAESRIQVLGGCDLKPTGGPLFHALKAVVGWRSAKQIQQIIYQSGYRRLALGWRLKHYLQQVGSSANG